MLNIADPNTPAAPSSPVEALTKALDVDVKALNNLILDRTLSDVPMIRQVSAYLIAAGGKRLRPLLTLAFARACNYSGDHHLKLAAAVEFIHTATLLHDDVVDESTLRRGKPSANEVFGNQASVLVGDFLFSRAFQWMVASDDIRALKILADASAIIAEGEVMQLAAAGDITQNREQYFKVVGAKTAALFSAACEVGAHIAKADPAVVDAAKRFGYHLGVAFQITDDVLDYAGQSHALGKNTGDDFKEGKLTLPVVLALEYAMPQEKEFWQRTMVDLQQRDGDFAYAQTVLDQHNAIQKSRELAEAQIKNAVTALQSLPESPLRTMLEKVAHFSIARRS